MINQTEQMTYRLSNLDIQQQRVSYQMSTKEVLDEGSDNSVLYARVIHIDDKVRTFEGIKDQIERTTVQNEAADTSMASIKNILDFLNNHNIKIKTKNIQREELKISTADISKLKKILKKDTFFEVEDYLKKELNI